MNHNSVKKKNTTPRMRTDRKQARIEKRGNKK